MKIKKTTLLKVKNALTPPFKCLDLGLLENMGEVAIKVIKRASCQRVLKTCDNAVLLIPKRTTKLCLINGMK